MLQQVIKLFDEQTARFYSFHELHICIIMQWVASIYSKRPDLFEDIVVKGQHLCHVEQLIHKVANTFLPLATQQIFNLTFDPVIVHRSDVVVVHPLKS